MSLQVEKLENNTAKLTIEVPAEEVEKAIESAYQKSKSKFSIPGFRKGKVPRKMIEKMYGVGVFYEDAVNSMIPGAYADAATESELEIVAQPEIDIVQIEAGKPFIFTAEVVLKPEVELGKYKGIEVEAKDTTVTDEEVDAELAIVEDAKMDIHEKMIKAQAQQMVEDFAQRIQSQGISFEQYMQFTGSTPEMLLEQVTPQAEERIKARLVLEAVVKAENIEVSDEEFEKELEEMAKQYNMELDQIKQFTTDADKETIKKDIAVQKAAKLVVDAAK